MSSYSILELNESSANSSANGDYSIAITPSTTLNTGDVVSLEKCFLDTTATGDEQIVIPEGGITLDFEVGYYIQSARIWGGMSTANGAANNYASAPPAGYLDNKSYVLVKDGAANGTTLSDLWIETSDWHNGNSQYNVPWAPAKSADYQSQGYYQAWALTIEYYKVGSTDVSRSLVSTDNLDWTLQDGHIWSSSTPITNVVYDNTKPVRIVNMNFGRNNTDGQHSNIQFQQWQNDQIRQATFKYTEDTPNDSFPFKFNIGFSTAPDDQNTPAVANITPYTRSTKDLGLGIRIPQGQYTQTDIAALINDGLGRNYVDPSVSDDVLRTVFLLNYDNSVGDFQDTHFVCIDNDANGVPLSAFDINPDASYTDGLLVGTTQIELNYDQARNQFFWQYNHMPFMGSAVTAPQVECVEYNKTQGLVAALNNKDVIIKRNAGIYFASVSSTDKDGNDVHFWQNMLGFSTGAGQDEVSFVSIPRAPYTGTINNWAVTNLHLPESLEVGKITTETYAGISGISDVTKAPPGDWWHMPDLSSPYVNNSSETIPIFSGHQDSSNQIQQIGYYAIEISGVGGGVLKAGDAYLNRHIMGVVGTYFAKNSYTQGSQADGFEYIHTGPPVALESFRVRILGPDKQVASNLGRRNTVMLRIQKGEVAIPRQIKMSKKEDEDEKRL